MVGYSGLWAQEMYFPVGAIVMDAISNKNTFDSVAKASHDCGFSVFDLHYWYPSEYICRLKTLDSLGMKGSLLFAPLQYETYKQHNISQFASGVHAVYDGNHDYYGRVKRGDRVGLYDRGVWVCEEGERGYAINFDPLQALWDRDGEYTKHRNEDCRKPFSTFDSRCTYKVYYKLKYKGLNNGDTVCFIRVENCTDLGQGVFSKVIAKEKILTTKDFSGPNLWHIDSLCFEQAVDSIRWKDFTVFSSGKKKIYIDYIELQDAAYDSLSKNMIASDEGVSFDQIVKNISNVYSGPNSKFKTAVFRYYLADEPFRSQFDATARVMQLLMKTENPVPGYTQLAPRQPPQYGFDLGIYQEFIEKTDPEELYTCCLPLRGKAASFRTPEDSGSIFQGRLDTLCILANMAQKAAQSKGKNWWFQVQSFGDYSRQDPTIEGYWRLPTPRELACMVNLAICYGAKGVFYYLYRSCLNVYKGGYSRDSREWWQLGLTDTLNNPTSLWYAAQKLNKNISAWAPTLINLERDTTFTAANIPPDKYIKMISDQRVQCGLFHNKGNRNDKYFMLVNRNCLLTDTVNLLVHLNCQGKNVILDVLTNQPVSECLPSGITVPFKCILNPGEGKLFHLMICE
jgi:hypothetical protein